MDELLDKIQRKMRWNGIENLPLFIVATQGIVFMWLMFNPQQVFELILNPQAIIQNHEYWRLISFLFIVPTQNVLFTFFYLYLQYVYGTALENEWGSFKFTVFYIVGALGTIVAAFFFGDVAGALFLNASIFLAFSVLYPNFTLLLFFILPVKIKWIALLTWVLYAIQFFAGSIATKMAILVSLVNYFLFFGGHHYDQIKAYYRREAFKRKMKD